MDAIPLTDEDRAILALEGPQVAGHTCKLIELREGAPDIDDLRRSIAGRLERAPMLTWSLAGSPSAPEWIPGEVEIRDHVVEAGTAAPADLPRRVAEVFAEHLNRDRPLWRIDRISLDGGGVALVWRIHHALADGTTAMHIADAALWDFDPEPAPTPATHPPPHSHTGSAAQPGDKAHDQDQRRRRGHLAAFLGRELIPSLAASPFGGRIGAKRSVAFARVELKPLHDGAKLLAGATLNDAVLTCVGGGLRAWMTADRGGASDIRVRIPVSMHQQGADAGNRDSFFSLPLPVHDEDPATRLARIAAATAERKQAGDAGRIDEISAELGRLSPRLQQLASALENSPRSFALSVSNVPGPRTRRSVLGAPVTALYSLAEIGRQHALRIAVISHGGNMCFGICADADLIGDLDLIAAGIERDAAALSACV